MSLDLEKEIEDENKKLEINKLETKNKIDVTEREIKKYRTIAWVLVWAGVASLLLGIVPFVGIEPSKSIFNLYGDFVGGVVSSLWSLAGLLFIYLAFLGQKQQLLIQQLELKYSQIEIKATRLELLGQKEQMKIQNDTLINQRFENTFFQLLQSQNEIIKLIDLKRGSGGGQISGRDCFKVFYNTFDRDYKTKLEAVLHNTLHFNKEESTLEVRKELTLAEVEEVYLKVFDLYEGDLGHYFRNLYHIFRFVDEANISEKKKYTRLVRSQLSAYELVLVFYNGFSTKGKEKFKPLIEKYKVLKNMNFKLLFNESHKSAYDPSAYGE